MVNNDAVNRWDYLGLVVTTNNFFETVQNLNKERKERTEQEQEQKQNEKCQGICYVYIDSRVDEGTESNSTTTYDVLRVVANADFRSFRYFAACICEFAIVDKCTTEFKTYEQQLFKEYTVSYPAPNNSYPDLRDLVSRIWIMSKEEEVVQKVENRCGKECKEYVAKKGECE
jgi:hypothetical protein